MRALRRSPGDSLKLPGRPARASGELPARDLAGSRILVVMPSTPLQGMERANLLIMKTMRRRGAEILFVTHARYGRRVRQEVERIGCRWTGASFDEQLRLPRTLRDLVAVGRSWSRTAWQLRAIWRDFRPTHVHATNLTYLLHTLPAVPRGRARVIFRLPNPPDRGFPPVRQRLSDWIWRRCVAPACDVLVCNCRYSADELQRLGVPEQKVRVIHNAAPERDRPPQSDAPRLARNRLNVVFLGRIRPEKGVGELFEAARRLVVERPDVDFYFCGEHQWRNPFAERLIGNVAAAGSGSRLRFTGEIDDVFGLLEQCDLHVCPSVSSSESFPNVVLEAKSAGLPSVVFPTAGLPEAVTHLVDGFVCRDRSADALYEGIRYFLDNPAARFAAGQAARASLERFAPRRIADQWAAVFRSG